jgi:hypothetical protein
MSTQEQPVHSAAPAPNGGPVASAAFKGVLVAMVVVGAVAFFVALSRGEAARAWQAYLVNFLFWFGVAEGGVVVCAAFYLTQGRWAGTTHFRLAEAWSMFVPLGFVLFWGLYFGRTMIFPWVLHPVADKAAWLNTPFLFARDGIALAVLTILSMWLVNSSRSEEAQAWALSSSDIEMPPSVIRKLAPTVAIAYCAVMTLISFDLIMSLAPVWHSTLFGWWFFAGMFWTAICAMALTAVILRPRLGEHNVFQSPKVRHDLGKGVFAFSVFWVYLLFAQYIVIWYGDIPTETFFIVQRVYVMPWKPLSYVVVTLIWVIPFLVLLGVRPKKTPAILGTVALGGLVGMWLELYVLVVPSLSQHVVPFGWIELLITIGFLGAFVLCALPGLDLVAQAATSGEIEEAHE